MGRFGCGEYIVEFRDIQKRELGIVDKRPMVSEVCGGKAVLSEEMLMALQHDILTSFYHDEEVYTDDLEEVKDIVVRDYKCMEVVCGG